MSTYSDPNSSVDNQEVPGVHPDMIKSMEETRKLGDYTHAVNEYTRKEETRQELAQQQRGRELENPHSAKDPSEYGFGENLTELKNAVVGGFRDTASSAVTLGERAVDMARGEDVGSEDYELDFDPLGGDLNPETNTWWGEMIRGGVHFGSSAAAIMAAAAAATAVLPASAAGAVGVGAAAAGAAKKGVGLAGAAKWIATGGKLASTASTKAVLTSKIGHGLVVGGVSDLVSEYSQDHNASGALMERLGERYPPFLGVLATKNADSPMMKTLKNVVEGGITGSIFETASYGIGRALKAKPGTPEVKLTGADADMKPDQIEMVYKTGDEIFERKRVKVEQEAKAALNQRLMNETAQDLFARGIDFGKLSNTEQIEQMTRYAKSHKKDFNTWSPPENSEQRAVRKMEERRQNVDDQIVEMGQMELEFPGFGAYKNKPIADFHQGNSISTGSAYEASKDLKLIHTSYEHENGSSASVLTTRAAQNIADQGFGTAPYNKQLAIEMLGDNRYQALRREIKREGKNPDRVFKDAYERMLEITEGRDAGRMNPDEYYQKINEDITFRTGGSDSMEAWAMENVVAADLIVGSVLKQARDLGIAARELVDHVDIADSGSVLSNLRNNIIVGLEGAKRARYLISQEFRSLQALDPNGWKAKGKVALAEMHNETKAQVDMMLELATRSPNDDLLHGVLEAFSMSNKIQNWQDLDKYMRKRLLGETTEAGKRKTGILIKELQGVMINSVLSGPKTPLRAIMGTSTAVFTRPIAQLMGGTARFITGGFKDATEIKHALASANAMVQAVPEAFTFFKSRLNSYWSGDISTIRSRFQEYSAADNQWRLQGEWVEMNGTAGDKAAYYVANMARMANNNNLLTYSTKLMAATDDAFTLILARARAKEKALSLALESKADGLLSEISPDLMKNFEDRFYADIFDEADGSVNDKMLAVARGEATLTKDLTGFGKSMDQMFDSMPLLKPFYLFARTGINGLEFSMKHLPGVNLLVKEYNDIMRGGAEDLPALAKYGITTMEELNNAKALAHGRWMMGSGVVFMAGQHYLNGNLTGNGPMDVQKRQTWLDAGYKPRSIKVGDVWVGYDSLEPFSNLLAMVADIGDNQQLMGEEYDKAHLGTLALVTAKALVSKTYLQGVQQLTDLFSNDPKAIEKIGANLLNNTMPLSSVRNEIGRIINPHMKELSSGFFDTLRNRNLYLEGMAGQEALRTKYDILTGRPINDWDVATRMLNAISPVQFNLDNSAGRKFLFKSGYDLRTSTMSAPDGTSLSDSPNVRSMFQQAIGDQDLETSLANLAKRSDVQQSIREMEQDLKGGRRGIDPMTYRHNVLIKNLMDNARDIAWSRISNNPEVLNLISARQQRNAANFIRRNDPQQARGNYDRMQELLNIYR
tara:strand:+ start:3900 stop:8069 length:4170 start_codon:yes stop_codon:yes gene_type:complete